eukprot:m.282113 g.282113  ORF g.282113 m.282113 type:complete len:333 (+) comp40651_c0_seq57:2934-3932(+)
MNLNITKNTSLSHCSTPTSNEEDLSLKLRAAVNTTRHGIEDKETVVMVGQLLENISKNLEDMVVNEKDLDDVVQLVSQTLEANSTVITEAQRERKSSSKIITALGEITSVVVIGDKRNVSIVKPKIVVAIVNPAFQKLSYSLTFGYIQQNLIQNSHSHSFTESALFLLEDNSVGLPSSLENATFMRLSQDVLNKSRSERIHFFAFANGKLFQNIESESEEIKKTEDLNSFVIGARIGANSHTDLHSAPVTLQFILFNTSLKNETCAFWNLSSQDGHGEWSNRCCRLANTSEKGKAVCECDHLTNFGILTVLRYLHLHVDASSLEMFIFKIFS